MCRPASSRLLALCVTLCAIAAPAFAQQSPSIITRCRTLASFSLDHAKVVSAEPAVSATLRKQTRAVTDPAAPADICRVIIADKPSADSDIRTEVWLPLSGWSGRFRGEGNGGFAGEIYYDQMATAVAQHDATAGTDTGHTTTTGTFALGHPEKVIDFGWRAIHDMTLQAKQIIAAFYGSPAQHSYFAACSDGGREALMEAERFPTDYDGILAGAPAYHWTALVSAAADNEKRLHSSPAANIPPAKVPAIASAVRAACDAKDGLADGILNDPRTCGFDPATLLCKSTETDSCLTPAQATSLKTIYAAKRNASGKVVIPGFLPGAEDDDRFSWPRWILGTQPLQLFFATGFYSNFVYQDPRWDLQSFDFPRDYALATARTGAALNATDTNLKPFFAHGGRIVLYHGWNDPAIPAVGTIDYVNGVISSAGRTAVDTNLRLYMAPGMLHCSHGPGANDFGQDQALTDPTDPQHNLLTALEQWVEQGTAPAAITATKFTDDDSARPVVLTRPICPYPQLPKYLHGDPNAASSFTCAVPKP